MYKKGHFRLSWFRLIGLLISCMGLCANALWAQSEIVIMKPTDDTRLDPGKLCSFDGKRVRFICTEVPAADSCIWEIDEGIGTFGRTSLFNGNKKGDTILFTFVDAPKTGKIRVKLKSAPDKVDQELALVQIPQASRVSDIKWDPPICQNADVEFRIDPIDDGYQTKYLPGSLNFRWTSLPSGVTEVFDGDNEWQQNVSQPSDFNHTFKFSDENYKNGTVVVTPYTCDGPGGNTYRTGETRKTLEPFVMRGLYRGVQKYEHIMVLEKGIKEEGKDFWKNSAGESEDSDSEHKICRDYSEVDVNWNQKYGKEGYVYLGFGDYQTYMDSLAAGHEDLLPEYYYTYEWTYDETELQMAVGRMENEGDFSNYGFGHNNKSRVAFRVLAGNPAKDYSNEYKVKLTIRCDSCIQRGGDPADFTYVDSITLIRLDSISNFNDPDHPIDYEVEPHDHMVCAGLPTTLDVFMPDDVSKTNFSVYSHAEGWTISRKTLKGQALDPDWEFISSTRDAYTYKTTRTSWGSLGDTIIVEVYPANACFFNLGKDKGPNTKQFKIFVKNPPVPPVLYDPITGRKIRPQYTEEVWNQMGNTEPQKPEEAEHFFICNYTELYATSLTATHTYGLLVMGDTLFNPEGGATFRYVDLSAEKVFSNIKLNEDDKEGITRITPRFENEPLKQKDSSYVNFWVDAQARTFFESNRDAKIGFYAHNGCGPGDTGIYFVKIIDTLTALKINEDNRPRTWDTICEGTELFFTSISYESYFKPADIQAPEERAQVVTDRVDYDWKIPSDWEIVDDYKGAPPKLTVKVGPSSGLVQLRLGNRCGYGAYLDSSVFVYPFVRVNIVGDTTPCQGDEQVYKFKKVEGANAYQWTFPSDWKVTSQASEAGKANVAVCDQSSADAQDSITVKVQVGAERGQIYVVGKDTTAPGLKPPSETVGCNFKFDNYEEHNRDSLGIRVKKWTSRPELVLQPDTVCADNSYPFAVKKGSNDDDSVFFKWFLPSGWTGERYSKDSDTADILTALMSGAHRSMTVRVASSRRDCDATNKGDTLDIPVFFTDTVQVTGRFQDAHPDNKSQDKRANPTPCEGDTVYYTLQDQNSTEVYYTAFGIKSLYGPDEAAGIATLADGDEEGGEGGNGGDDGDDGDDGDGEGGNGGADDGGDEGGDEGEGGPTGPDWAFLEASGWKMLSKAPYHDTVKLVVGREPILLRAANVSHCDTSSFKQDTIRPIAKVIARGAITADRPDANLCEYEAVDFLFDTVQHATHYVFHYPWDVQTDTVKVADSAADRAAGRLTENYRYKIHFADTFAYDKGVIYLEAYNVCGVRPLNDTLKIASVLAPPAVPVLAQVDFDAFVYEPYHKIGADTVLDTICLRKPVVLEAGPNDRAGAEEAGWRFHYKWDTVRADTSMTVFERYPDAGEGLNAGDSLWTLMKEASAVKVNYLYLTSRHETCQRFGDTLTIALRNIDTTALQGEDRIWNYLYDKESQSDSKRIQTKPCATTSENVAYYLDLKTLDITGERYYFRWRKDSTQAYANVYDADNDNKLAGGGFILQNVPADGDGDGEPDWATLDTLKMALPSDADTLEIQVVVVNRCGEEAQMPGLRIQTADAITEADHYAVVMVSEYICDEEKLTFKVVSLNTPEEAGEDGEAEEEKTDGIDKAGLYIWHTPWRENPDTTDTFIKSYDALAYEEGSVYVVPNNGCGDGHESDALVILADEILRPPLRVQPVDFASGYDPAGETAIAIDSLCLRSDFDMTVKAMLSPSVDAPETDADGGALPRRDSISYDWATVYGVADYLKVNEDDSSKATVNVPDFADSAYIIYVAARRRVCQRYGDSLRIELFPMDTIRFIEDLVEDSLPFDKFVVLTRGVIRDTRPTPAIDTLSAPPCVGSAHTYTIIPGFHWSLLPVSDEHPENRPTFSWNGGNTGANPTTNVLDYTIGWVTDNAALLPAVLSIDKTGEADDILNLSVHALNLCGPSVSKPVAVRPQALIDAEQPQFKPLAALCEDDTIRVEVEPIAAATGYIWQTSFRSRPDTTEVPEIRYPDFKFADATVTVYGFNACGDGALSETLDLKPLLRIPNRPEAKWFSGLQMVGDTVYDTLCLHGDNLLWVEAAFDDEADDDVFYDWQLLPDYTEYANLTALPGQPLTAGPDSIYVTPVSEEMSVGDDLYLMVAARRASCRYWSDTLYIALHMTDTVSVSSLGSLVWYKSDALESDRTEEAPTLPLCPGAELRIGVRNETAAPAYRWQFPDPTWRFADDVTDTTAAVVKVVVGETEGVIRVSPMTDADNRRCAYAAPGHTLTSTTITLVPALPARVFASFEETPCAGTEVTYAIEPPATDELSDIARYRWEFPKGWRVYDADGNLTESNLLEPEALNCRVLPDSSAGIVKAYVLSKCGDDPNRFSVSKPVEKAVSPMDTARLEIVADATVCQDSTLQIDLKALNEWTLSTGYGLDVTYIGSDAAVVNPESPLTFDFPNAPDSSLVMVGWYSGDSVRLTFTPRHTGGCPNVLPVTYALRADTTPTIEGFITGPERICMGAEARFEATATNLEEGVAVAYHWEVLTDEGWEIVSGADSSVAVIKAGAYADETELERVIRCYPRALCGTALPFEYTLKVNPPAPFNGTLQAFYSGDATPLTPTDRPCIGSDLSFELTHADAPESVRYVWETPEGWNRLSVTGTPADSALYAMFTSSKAGEDTVRVRFLELNNPLSCGLSEPAAYIVAVRDSAPKAALTRLPYPCKLHTEITFLVAADEEIDSVYWTVPDAYDAAKAILTDAGSAIFYNRLTLTSQTGFQENFPLVLRSFNVCGTRDTVITVRPVDPIPDFAADAVNVSHYCPGDSAYAYVEIQSVYTNKGTSYHWPPDEVLTQVQDSLIREDDDPTAVEILAWMRFAGGAEATDTGYVRFYAQNDCNATATVQVRTAPYTYAVLARPGEDTVVYGRSDVSLAVVSVQSGTPADYTYVWYPQDRVTLSDPAAPDDAATTFATKGLYQPEEYFRVRATERIDTTQPFYFGHSACVAFDTVKIFVDSTFAMAMDALDTACMAVPFEISAKPYGGNTERYYFDWYRLVGDSVYEPMAEDDHTERLALVADAPSIKLMVIGRDSTFVYGEPTPDDPEEPENPENPDEPENPEDQPEPEDNPDDPEPLYVFTKVDTQYVEIQTFDVEGHLVQPGRDAVRVPFGTKVKLVAEATGGSRQYTYLWAPDELLDRHDNTMATVSTLRLYEDGAVILMIRDTVTGCSDTLQVLISMSDEIGDIPNAFSPNGDGINDIFMNGSDVIIFDRFGQELFRSTHQEGWDGTYKGKPVSPGEYLYVVTIRKDGQEYVKKGTVSVFTK